MDQHGKSANAVCTGIQGAGEMKLYAKIKVNGKWTMVSASSIAARVEAMERCECNVCRPDYEARDEMMGD
jgi:hypothetical protein